MTINADAYVRSNRLFEPSDLSIGGLLRQVASEAPDLHALKHLRAEDGQQRVMTYRELLSQAEDAARQLLKRHAPGDRIAILSGNRFEWTIAQFAAAIAGLTVVAINPGCAVDELRYFLEQSGASGIIFSETNRGRNLFDIVARLRQELPLLKHAISFEAWSDFGRHGGSEPLPKVDPLTPALIQYTSGTTGKPKGAQLSHRSLVNATKGSEEVFALEKGSVWLNTVPMYTTSGSVFVTMMAMWNRGTQLMLPAFDPELVCRGIEEEEAAFAPFVPTMALAVLNHPGLHARDLSSLRVVVVGGSTIAPDLVTRIDRELGADTMVIFGQTEAASTLCLTDRKDTMEHKTGTIGYPLGGIEIRIADPKTGQTLKTGEVGEICARGPSIMLGYYRMPEATAETLDKDGWLHTGDLGYLNEDGYPQISGRLKDVIIRGGSNIYPREIEDVLAGMEGVADSAVFGISDPHYGEIAVVAIRRQAGSSITVETVKTFASGKLARYKVPSHVWFVDAFPMTASGKIQKFALRKTFEDEMAANLPTQNRL